jgi:hypothetical protein
MKTETDRETERAILDRLSTRYGVDTVAFLTEALRAEQRAWDLIGGEGGRFRDSLPAILSRGLIAAPSVVRELVVLFDSGDTRTMKRCLDAFAGVVSSAEIPAFKAPVVPAFAPVSLEPISAAVELAARRAVRRA